MIKKLSQPGYGDEWYIIGLARGGAAVKDSTYETYYNNLVKEVKKCKGILDKRKYTEYSRVCLAVTAIGKDPRNVGGYNLLKKLVDNGMESPVALNQEDWSNAGHYFTQVYEEQDGTLTGTEKIMEDLRNGSVDLMSNERFTSLMDTYDLLMEYNINKADPLAADYDENAADLAEGDVAFWFNGNWAWAEISDYIEDDTEIGIMPVPQNGTEENANVNDYICGGATKQVMIDKECNDEKQQAAAKDFLDWLANTAEGNKVLVDDCSLVPAFSNITEEATNMLGQSIQRYTVEGKLFDQPSNYPGDHWSEVGAIMQKYLDKQIDRAEFAKEVQDYWTNLSE